MFVGHAVPIFRALKMDAAGSYETLVPTYEITRRNIADDSRPIFIVIAMRNGLFSLWKCLGINVCQLEYL